MQMKLRCNKSLVSLLLILILLMSTGCVGKTDPTDPSATTTQPPTTTLPSQTTPAATTVPNEAEDSLSALHQWCAEDGYAFAVAYFGDLQPKPDSQDPVDPAVQIPQLAPKLCRQFPFLPEIPSEHILGTQGHTFCIVPSGDAVNVKVFKAVWNGDEYEYTDLVYESKTCEPLILLCNDDGWESDACVTITKADGTVHSWYPNTDDRGYVGNIYDSNDQPLILDFSPYAELLWSDYFETMGNGWLSPTKWDLIGTTWTAWEYLDDDREVTYRLTFNEDTLTGQWNDGIDEEDHIYADAPWDIEYLDGVTVLTIDFQEFAGILKYNLLLDPTFEYLYTTVDMSTGFCEPGYERLQRIMTREMIEATDHNRLVGTWELGWTQVEDDWNYDRAGQATITITGDPEGILYISYTDKEFPDTNFTDRELYVEPGEIYFGCGNDKWFASVDHIGPYGTTYKVTVLDNGTLMMQQFWYMDNCPMVSYAWFTRAA